MVHSKSELLALSQQLSHNAEPFSIEWFSANGLLIPGYTIKVVVTLEGANNNGES